MTCTTVTLGGLVIDCDTEDANGITWTWTRIDGWEPPDLRADVLTLAGQDGEVFGEWRHRGRALVLAGVAHKEGAVYPFETEYWLAFNSLAAASNLVSGTGTLTVDEPTPKQMTVKRQGRPRMRPFQGRFAVMEWEIPLIASDWRKYGTTLNSDSSSPVNNGGNARSTPVVVITGASTTPRITNTTDDSKYVEVATSLTGGQTLTLDMQNRTATHSANGNVDSLIAAGSRWWDLLPGDNTVTLTGGGTFAVQYRDAYI